MKFTITFKDPDGVYESISDALVESVQSRDELDAAIRPWVEYGEYVTIEIDTDAKTARVVPVDE